MSQTQVIRGEIMHKTVSLETNRKSVQLELKTQNEQIVGFPFFIKSKI